MWETVQHQLSVFHPSAFVGASTHDLCVRYFALVFILFLICFFFFYQLPVRRIELTCLLVNFSVDVLFYFFKYFYYNYCYALSLTFPCTLFDQFLTVTQKPVLSGVTEWLHFLVACFLSITNGPCCHPQALPCPQPGANKNETARMKLEISLH